MDWVRIDRERQPGVCWQGTHRALFKVRRAHELDLCAAQEALVAVVETCMSLASEQGCLETRREGKTNTGGAAGVRTDGVDAGVGDAHDGCLAMLVALLVEGFHRGLGRRIWRRERDEGVVRRRREEEERGPGSREQSHSTNIDADGPADFLALDYSIAILALEVDLPQTRAGRGEAERVGGEVGGCRSGAQTCLDRHAAFHRLDGAGAEGACTRAQGCGEGCRLAGGRMTRG